MKAESVVSPSLLGACEAIVCNAARNCQDLLFREAMLRHNDDSSGPHAFGPSGPGPLRLAGRRCLGRSVWSNAAFSLSSMTAS